MSCPEYNAFNETLQWKFGEQFGECIYNVEEEIAFCFGWLSVMCWGVALLPQIIANYTNGSSESQSFGFWFLWLFGDSFNVAGCFLANTLITNTALAIVYLFFTSIAFVQFMYYQYFKPRFYAAKYNQQPDVFKTPSIAEVSHNRKDLSASLRRGLNLIHVTPRSVGIVPAFNLTKDLRKEWNMWQLQRKLLHERSLENAKNMTPKSEMLPGGKNPYHSYASVNTTPTNPLTQLPTQTTQNQIIKTMPKVALKRSTSEPMTENNKLMTQSKKLNNNNNKNQNITVDKPRTNNQSVIGLTPPQINPTNIDMETGPAFVTNSISTVKTNQTNKEKDTENSETNDNDNNNNARESESITPKINSVKPYSQMIGLFITSGSLFSQFSHFFNSNIRNGDDIKLLDVNSSINNSNDDWALYMGMAFGWIATSVYVISRIPQLRLIFKTKQVVGLSPLFFIITTAGNFTQMLSMLIRKHYSIAEIKADTPWLLSAALCMVEDCTLLFMIYYYRNNKGTGADDSIAQILREKHGLMIDNENGKKNNGNDIPNQLKIKLQKSNNLSTPHSYKEAKILNLLSFDNNNDNNSDDNANLKLHNEHSNDDNFDLNNTKARTSMFHLLGQASED